MDFAWSLLSWFYPTTETNNQNLWEPKERALVEEEKHPAPPSQRKPQGKPKNKYSRYPFGKPPPNGGPQFPPEFDAAQPDPYRGPEHLRVGRPLPQNVGPEGGGAMGMPPHMRTGSRPGPIEHKRRRNREGPPDRPHQMPQGMPPPPMRPGGPGMGPPQIGARGPGMALPQMGAGGPGMGPAQMAPGMGPGAPPQMGQGGPPMRGGWGVAPPQTRPQPPSQRTQKFGRINF